MIEFLQNNPMLLVAAIFVARVGDVSLGTVRTIMVFRGYALLAAAIGFFEVILWVIAAGQVLNNLDAWYLAVAYAGGFAAGNYAGIWLESKMAMGDELIRVITFRRDIDLGNELRDAGYRAIDLEGDRGPGEYVEIVIVVAPRRRMPGLVQLIQQHDPNAIFTINDVKQVHEGELAYPHRAPFFGGWRVMGKRK